MTNIDVLNRIGYTIVMPKIESSIDEKYFIMICDAFSDPTLQVFFNISDTFKDDDSLVPLTEGKSMISLLKADPFNIGSLSLGNDYMISKSLAFELNVEEDSSGSDTDETVLILPDFYDTEYYYDIYSVKSLALADYDYLKSHNTIIDSPFTEDELRSFKTTFVSAVLEYSDESNRSDTNQNLIYETVLNYYLKDSDTASTLLSLILGTQYGVGNVYSTSCSCNSSLSSSSGTVTDSCASLYTSALASILKTMLGDCSFYCEWFMKYQESGSVPNDMLIDRLIDLIDSLISSGIDISLASSSHDCTCGILSNISESACSVEQKLLNYKQVLEWVKEGKIIANSNKIKAYGEAFGEILPSLSF